MCSWRRWAAPDTATCWSSTTADGQMRLASGTWSCWRHRRRRRRRVHRVRSGRRSPGHSPPDRPDRTGPGAQDPDRSDPAPADDLRGVPDAARSRTVLHLPAALAADRRGHRGVAKPDQYRKLPSLRRWRRLRPERSSREARRQAAAASGHETKGPAGAAAACGSSVTRGQPTRCYIGAHPTAPMPHRVGTGQHRAGAGR